MRRPPGCPVFSLAVDEPCDKPGCRPGPLPNRIPRRPRRAGVVLDDDQGVAGLFKNAHELKDCEGLAVKLAMLLQLLSLSNTTILSAQ